MGRGDDRIRVFRPALWLRVPVAAALSCWIAVMLAAVVGHLSLPLQVWVSMGFFVALFTLVGAYYWSMRITVDEYAVTYKGMLAFRSYAYDDILEVRVTPAPGLTNYDVRTRWDGLCFSSLIAGHRDLAKMIVDRAHLSNRPR